MQTLNKKQKQAGKILVAMAMAGTLGGEAFAGSLNSQTFSPVSGSKYMLTESALVDAPLRSEVYNDYHRFNLSLTYNYLDTPLVALDEPRENRLATLVKGLQTLDLMAGFEYDGLFSINMTMPMNMVNSTDKGNQFAAGDLRLFGKYYFSKRRESINVALVPEIRLPTGSAELFTSETTAGFGLGLAFEREFDNLSAALNFGYYGATGATYADADYRNRLPISLGLFIPLSTRWGVNTEARGAITLPANKYQNPSELYGGLRYNINDELVVNGGASVGSFNNTSSADYRIIVGLRFSPLPNSKLVDTTPVAPLPPVKVVQSAPIKPATPKKPRVIFANDRLVINEEVKFEHDRDVLTLSGRELLDEVADVIKTHKKRFKFIQIEGHTNRLGTDQYNMKLSRGRAATVKEYLASRGIRAEALKTAWYGKRHPKSLTHMSEKAKLVADRRVEFKVLE